MTPHPGAQYLSELEASAVIATLRERMNEPFLEGLAYICSAELDALASEKARADAAEARLSTAYRVKAECNDEANFQRKRANDAEATISTLTAERDALIRALTQFVDFKDEVLETIAPSMKRTIEYAFQNAEDVIAGHVNGSAPKDALIRERDEANTFLDRERGFVSHQAETIASLTEQLAEATKGLQTIADGYGPNHMSTFCRFTARATLSRLEKQEGEA